MLSFSSIFIIFFLGFFVFYWQFRMRAKEVAFAHAKKICENHQLQLLDQSISFSKITIEKRFGRYCLIKIFEFDYADNLQNRKTGSLLFYKNQLLSIHIDNQNIIQSRAKSTLRSKTGNTHTKTNSHAATGTAEEGSHSNIIQFPGTKKSI